MTNMNGINVEELTRLVMAQVQAQLNVSPETTDVQTVEDGGIWAKNSKYYGKVIAGQVFNPYMVRWHLQKQFQYLMTLNDGSVYKGVNKRYDYMYSINYTLEEVRKLAMLQKKDRIAFNERSLIFTLPECQSIFTNYIYDYLAELKTAEKKFCRDTRNIGRELRYALGISNWGVVCEKISNHKVKKYLKHSESFDTYLTVLNDLIVKIRRCNSYDALYKLMASNVKYKVKHHSLNKEFVDCFILGGAYYTLKQKLMFEPDFSVRGLHGEEGINEVRRELESGIMGYQMYGILKKAMGMEVYNG